MHKRILILIACVLAGLFACKNKDTTYNASPEVSSSRYYVLDIGVKIPRPGFTILPISGYQQTTEYTCGPAAVLTLLKYYGMSGDEMTIAREMGTSTTTGTNLDQMVNWL